MKSGSKNFESHKVFKGEQTKREILRKAVDIASREGLNGLTIGKLAVDLDMSKSGLYSHFGSKEELQVAVIGHAREVFIKEVVDTTENEKDGLFKLYAMLKAWLSQIERGVFSGGSFFAAAALELDDWPGRPREFVVEISGRWLATLEKEARLAIRLGELKKSCDVKLLIFQVYGHVHQSNWLFRLHRDEAAFELGKRAIIQSLRHCCTGSGLQILETA